MSMWMTLRPYAACNTIYPTGVHGPRHSTAQNDHQISLRRDEMLDRTKEARYDVQQVTPLLPTLLHRSTGTLKTQIRSPGRMKGDFSERGMGVKFLQNRLQHHRVLKPWLNNAIDLPWKLD